MRVDLQVFSSFLIFVLAVLGWFFGLELGFFNYKLMQTALKKVEKSGLCRQTRKIGNAQAYRFLVENLLSGIWRVALNSKETEQTSETSESWLLTFDYPHISCQI